MTPDTMDQNRSAGPQSAKPTRADLDPAVSDDFAAHQRTYRGVVRAIVIFVAHTLVILALMAYFLT